MEEVSVVRHKVMVEGMSVRKVARELGISRHTVTRYVDGAPAGVRRPVAHSSPVSESVRPRLEAILNESPRWTGGKQRLTGARMHELLCSEGLKVSPRQVRSMMAEHKRRRQEVFVPLVYHPGDLGEVDFFEVLVDLNGTRQKAWMFVMRLMHSGRDFAKLYPRQDQTCFLDGHVAAFAHFGAVPNRLLYDNLKAAVRKILVGSERELTTRFLALTTHYLFEANFARPATGHDKGGVESRGRAIRWQHLVPIPNGPNFESINTTLLSRLDARMGVDRNAEGKTIAERFTVETSQMLPLHGAPFHVAKVAHGEVTRRALVTVEGSTYSVWSEWAGLSVMAYASVNTVELVDRSGTRVVHQRVAKGKRSVDYRHYLRELASKPQAVRQVAAELIRDLGAPYDLLWPELVDEHGPKRAAQIFASVIRSIGELGEDEVSQRVQKAMCSGESILLALRSAPPTASSIAEAALPESLRNVDVQAGSAADYDTLLGGAS